MLTIMLSIKVAKLIQNKIHMRFNFPQLTKHPSLFSLVSKIQSMSSKRLVYITDGNASHNIIRHQHAFQISKVKIRLQTNQPDTTHFFRDPTSNIELYIHPCSCNAMSLPLNRFWKSTINMT